MRLKPQSGRTKLKLLVGMLVSGAALLMLSGVASAHGYIESPKSRSYQCRQTGGCGAVQYEPQSVEGPDRFPESGARDGKIASGDSGRFGTLDEQSENRWPRQKMSSGPNTFTWHLTAAHFSRDWRYYITKEGWDPNAPISRSQFDLTPFCTNGNSRPGTKESHSCNVPQRTGYHLILGVWDVGDTSNSFYQIIDAQFSGTNQPVTQAPATTAPPSTQAPATTAPPATRPYPSSTPATQQKVKETQPSTTATTQPSTTASVDTSAEVKLPASSSSSTTTPAGSGFGVTGVEASYTQNERVTVNFTVSTPDKARVRYIAMRANSRSRLASGFYKATPGSANVGFQLNSPQPGDYWLFVVGRSVDGKRYRQRIDFTINEANEAAATSSPATVAPVVTTPPAAPKSLPAVENNYSFEFPNQITSYTAGTRVLQPKDGRVYECKPFPFSGFCVQWSPSVNLLEPGVGPYWQLAWRPL